MNDSDRRILTTQSLAHLGAFGIMIGSAFVFYFPPATSKYYPRCPVFVLFHVLCPGCGSTRALAALLHGHLFEALHWNAMFVLLLPFIIGFLAIAYYRAIASGAFAWPRIPNRWLMVTLGIVLAFAILRNVHSL